MRRLAVAACAAVAGLALAPAALAGRSSTAPRSRSRTIPSTSIPQAQPSLTRRSRPSSSPRSPTTATGRSTSPCCRGAQAEAGGDAGEALRKVADSVGAPGVYAIVAGGQFRAGATGDSGLGRGEAAKLATAAFAAHHDDGLAATLVDFVDRVGDARERRLGGERKRRAASRSGGCSARRRHRTSRPAAERRRRAAAQPASPT